MLHPQYIGQQLLTNGFETFFRYMFRVVEGRPFILEPIHNELIESFERIHRGEKIRLNINIPPRSAKTTLAKYFIVYSLTINPKCNFIYTSYSQSLLSDIAREIINILEHPSYKAMFNNRYRAEEEEVNPVNDFWREYLKNQDNKNIYTSKKIITSKGGVVLFASIGSQLTGFGCGSRGASKFSGALILDDANKPADIRSGLLREKTARYFEETLLSRLNDSNVPIINIQQRLHLEDLSGYLQEKYQFETLKKPLLVDGVCQIPSQYTPERIKELQTNEFMFSSQYQQEPIMEGGNLIKTNWLVRYTMPPQDIYQTFIVCDTAFSDKKSADYTVFGLFGISSNQHLYLLDAYYKRVIFPDMVRDLTAFYNQARAITSATFSSIYIENKGSGISLIQQLRLSGLPIRELTPVIHKNKTAQVSDKYTRFLEISADLESGYLHIPESATWMKEFLLECAAFTGGKQNEHDDFVDACVIYPLKIRREYLQEDWDAVKRAFG